MAHSVEVLLHQVLQKKYLTQLPTVPCTFPCKYTFPLSWSISFPMVDISLAKPSRVSPSVDDLSSLRIHSCMMASESSCGSDSGKVRCMGGRRRMKNPCHSEEAGRMQSYRGTVQNINSRTSHLKAAPHTLSLNISPMNLRFPRDL